MPRTGYLVPNGDQPALCARCRLKFPATRLKRDGDNPQIHVCDECYDNPIKVAVMQPEDMSYQWVQPENTGPSDLPANDRKAGDTFVRSDADPFDDDSQTPQWPYSPSTGW